MKNEYLECAMIASTHGVRGTVKLENRCDTPSVLASLTRMYKKDGDTYTEMKVVHSSVQKNMVLTSFEGITDVDAAAAMKGTVLYAKRSDFKLKKGDYFIADLIGLPVIDAESGETHGTVSDVIAPAGRSIYVVEKPDGGSFMIPAVREFIKKVETDGEKAGVYVCLIEGMTD